MTLKPNILPQDRIGVLGSAIDRKGAVRLIEAHNGLSALVGEEAFIEVDGEKLEFDGLWASGLTDSAARGLPDAEIVGPDSRLRSLEEIARVTSKPIVVDGDTGGVIPQLEYYVRDLERLGISGVIIEDKVFPKRNSLDPGARQTLADPDEFSTKICQGKKAMLSKDFMVIARLESLIAGAGLDDALSRAERYVEAGVDGIMIHSKRESPDDVLSFAKAYESLCETLDRRPYLVCVPTTYNLITDRELAEAGFNIIIHANHLLRTAHKSMMGVAETILTYDRGFEAEPFCSPTSDIFSVVGFNRITAQDRALSPLQRLHVIIPAAGEDPVFPEVPKSLIRVAGRPILTEQLESVRKAGLQNVVIVNGHMGDLVEKEFADENLIFRNNPDYQTTHSLQSLFCAEDKMEDGFLLSYSDILCDSQHLTNLIRIGQDIVLLVDSSYRYHRHEVDKRLDLVVSKEKRRPRFHRSLHPTGLAELERIGKEIDVEVADYEFAGVAYFSEEGARILRKVYHDAEAESVGAFHEARSFPEAGVTDLIQEVIDRGFSVYGLQVYKGWMEIHNRQDVELAEREMLRAN